jgi:CBS domain-containing protein
MIRNILDRKGNEVFAIGPEAALKTAADLMRAHNIAALVVTVAGRIAGLLSEREIAMAVSERDSRAPAARVGEVMIHDVPTVSSGDGLRRAMRLMSDHRVRHLPVLEDGQLVGLVSIGDVVKQRLEDLETEANVLRDVAIAVH